jgi:arylsulfatase A-like enzyme
MSGQDDRAGRAGRHRPWIQGIVLILGLVGLAAFGPSAAAPVAASRPNIVVIVVDDAGYTDFGAYGSEIATPTIDALAAGGTKFTNFHATPMCAPSRAMLLTGVDSHTAGIGNLPESTPAEHRDSPGYQGRLAGNVVTVASLLKDAGYHTYMAGKWHLGHGAADLPDRRGFDKSYALDATGGDNWEQRPYLPIYTGADWYENGRPATLPKDFHASKFLVDRMIRYIDETPADGRPFFAYLPFLAIHIPNQAPAEYVAKYEARYGEGWRVQRQHRYQGAVRAGLIPAGTPMGPVPANVRDWETLSKDEQLLSARRMAVNAGMLEAMDSHLGRLIAHLKATGKYDNTLFVLLSDNGPEAGDPTTEPAFRLWMKSVGYSMDIKGLGGKGTFSAIGPGWASAAAAPGSLFKFYTAEGGTRVPLIVAGPGVEKTTTTRAFSIITDITPTLLDYAGVKAAPAPAAPLIGRSLRPLLGGAAQTVYDAQTPIGMEAAGDAALYKGDLKLTRSAGPLGDPTWRLYDIARDPGETLDLTDQAPDQARAMLADYRAYAARVGVVEVPAGYTPDRQVAKAVLTRILEQFTLPLILAGLALLGLLVWLILRMRKAGNTAGQIAVRLLLGVTGILGLFVASRFWMAPATAAKAFALIPDGAAGLGTLRADMAAFAAATGGLSLAAAVRREGRWLWPVLLLLVLALSGRTLNLAFTGGGEGLLGPMVAEAALIAITLWGLKALPRRRGPEGA